METGRPAARRRSPEWAVGASDGAPDARNGSTAQTWWDRSSATRAVSSATTDTRPGSVPAHRPEETPAISVLSAAGRSPTPRGCDGRAARPKRSAACPECGAANARETRRSAGCGWRRETAGNRSSTRSRPLWPTASSSLKWYCSTGVCPRGAQVQQRCGRSLNPLSSMKTIVRPSFLAFFLTRANVSASTSGSSLRPAPGRARWDADSSSPTAAGCAKPARHDSGPRIPPRSGAPPATPSTNRFRNPVLPARASARPLASAGLAHSAEVCVRRAPLSANRGARRPPVAGPSGSPTGDGPRPGVPLRTDGLPFSATAPPASAAAPTPESLAALPLGFPWANGSTDSQECHYIIQYSIGFGLDFFFAHRFFIFPNAGATLKIEAPAVGRPVPIEEYVFYLTGFIAVLLIYVWMDEFWLAAYNVPDYHGEAKLIPRLLQFHPTSAILGVVLIAAAVVYKKKFSATPEGFPGYFTFLVFGGLVPAASFFPTTRRFINWRAFSLTFFFILLVSLLWEATLAKPYGWWDYQPEQMIGLSIGAWSGLPIEAICVWIAVTYATVIVFEVVKLWQASEKPARDAFLGSKKPAAHHA